MGVAWVSVQLIYHLIYMDCIIEGITKWDFCLETVLVSFSIKIDIVKSGYD